MSDRVDLLNRADHSSTSPFLLCNIVARRARQMATTRSVSVSPELINLVFAEYFEGRIRCEVSGPGPGRAFPGVNVVKRADRKHPVAAATASASERVLEPVASG